MGNRDRILDKAVSLPTNALGKGMHPSLLPFAIVNNIKLWFDIQSRRNSNLLNSALKIDLGSHPGRAEGLVNTYIDQTTIALYLSNLSAIWIYISHKTMTNQEQLVDD